MDGTIQRQSRNNHQNKYTLRRDDDYILACIRSMFVFMGILLVLIVGGMIAFGESFDIFQLVTWLMCTPFAVMNTIFIWFLYRFKIDRKPLASVIFCFLESLLVIALHVFIVLFQFDFPNLFFEDFNKFWASECMSLLITFLIVLAFYLIKKWLTSRIKKDESRG